jgi:hypothetical protein
LELQEDDTAAESTYERMGRVWLGLGNLGAPCWFIGMEPGGADVATWPDTWATQFKGAPMIDLPASATKLETKYLGPKNQIHKTWSSLIRLRLAYAGKSTDDADVLLYQRQEFCRIEGGEALVEISAYAATSLDVVTPKKKYLKSRVKHLRDLIGEYRPEIVVCYGTTYTGHYEEICGGAFYDHSFRQSGSTLCALTMHPYQRYGKSPPPEFWIDKGHEMRRRVDERLSPRLY